MHRDLADAAARVGQAMRDIDVMVLKASLCRLEISWLSFCFSRGSIWDQMCADTGRVVFGQILVSGDLASDFPRLARGLKQWN